jgi:hypothetical protein
MVALWQADELILRRYKSGLVDAARLVLARWESGDLGGAVRQLAAAVAMAEGDVRAK